MRHPTTGASVWFLMGYYHKEIKITHQPKRWWISLEIDKFCWVLKAGLYNIILYIREWFITKPREDV